MKIFYFYDDTEDTLKLKHQFETNLPSDLVSCPNLIENNFCQKSHGGGYYGWLCKYQTVLEGFKQTKTNEYFIFSDIDIRFYSTPTDKISLDKDWYFQQETYSGKDINIGFMIIKNCDNSKNFWNEAKKIIEQNKYLSTNGCYKIQHQRGNGSGQFIINDLLYKYTDLSWDKLSLRFWSGSIGLEFLSKDIILHHANAVHGMRKKINQLDYISQVLTRL